MTRNRVLHAFLLIAITLAAAAAAAVAGAAPPAAPGTVTIPLEAYDRLVDRAAHPPKSHEPPPIAATVARASMQAQVTNGVVRGTIELAGEVVRTGAVKVPLVSGAVLTSAERAGKPIALTVDGATHAAILQGPESFDLTLGFVVPVVQEPGRASCQLPLPLARSTRLSLDIPRGHAEVLLEGGLRTASTSSDGKTRIEATLEAGRAARVSWTVRDMNTAVKPHEARWVSEVSTLATVGEIDLGLTVMLDVSVIMGDPASFDVRLPEGFELTNSSGASLDGTRSKDGVLTLVVNDPSRRRHQFLLALERTTKGGLLETEVPLLSLAGAQRETGEVAVEGLGTMELEAKEEGTLKRMDVREAGPTLRALARQPLLAAFRYHRRPSEPLRLAIEAQRFPDAPVLAAMAETAEATTLVTAEGRSITSVSLSVRNQAQPYLRLSLPEGATLVSAGIAGQAVKPVEGTDGARVPLLRPGFRPNGPYEVSFVYMGAGSAFAKKGEARLTLARMDLPISALYWEMFVPDKYKIKKFGGQAWQDSSGCACPRPSRAASAVRTSNSPGASRGGAVGRPAFGQLIRGTVTDPTGAAIANAQVTITNEATNGSQRITSNSDGSYQSPFLSTGSYQIEVDVPGFKTAVRQRVALNASELRELDFRLETGNVTESVSVEAEPQAVRTVGAELSSTVSLNSGGGPGFSFPSGSKKVDERQPPSQNVVDLQRRVAGVLPIRIDVPRTGTSVSFVRPLVLDEETTVTFQYKRR